VLLLTIICGKSEKFLYSRYTLLLGIIMQLSYKHLKIEIQILPEEHANFRKLPI